jgi:hypothetical protein
MKTWKPNHCNHNAIWFKVLRRDHGRVVVTDLGMPTFLAHVFLGGGCLGLTLGSGEGVASNVFALCGGVSDET